MTALSPYSYGPTYQPAFRNTYPNQVAVSIPALHTDLVALATVKTLLGITTTAQDARLSLLIGSATASIETFCGRTFGLQQYTETMDVDSAQQLVLEMNPIAPGGFVSLTGYSGSPPVPLTPVTALDQIDYASGIITYDMGFTTGRNIAIYYGGFWLPGDDVAGINLSVIASDKSFNSASAAFPLLYPGAPITVSGFTNPANNGSFTVVSATASKVIVNSTVLVDEAAGAAVTVAVRNLPKDVEMAAAQLVMIDNATLDRDTTISQESISGVYGATYSNPGSSKDPLNPLPPNVAARLRKYVRLI